jgi:hypothetical protein
MIDNRSSVNLYVQLVPRNTTDIVHHKEFYSPLRIMCVERLSLAINSSSKLFDRQLRDGCWQGTLGTEDITSTAICLLGISRAGIDEQDIGFSVMKTLDALVTSASQRGYMGGMGLVVWANAVCGGVPFAELSRRLNIGRPDASCLLATCTSMEIAWLTSGLAHEVLRSGDEQASRILGAARAELLSRYQRNTELFKHASRSAPWKQRARMWVANFADQIYSVQALAYLAALNKDSEALAAASGCAYRLVRLQGEFGQWWWHYDPRDGSVAQRYPVYSVHQHGMAPMALVTLEKAGGPNLYHAVEKSRAWLTVNEYRQSMVDKAAGTIWRDIDVPESLPRRRIRQAGSALGLLSGQLSAVPGALKLNRETRPYEWAWCLFASALELPIPAPGHII